LPLGRRRDERRTVLDVRRKKTGVNSPSENQILRLKTETRFVKNCCFVTLIRRGCFADVKKIESDNLK
jgi:hypothetical protein